MNESNHSVFSIHDHTISIKLISDLLIDHDGNRFNSLVCFLMYRQSFSFYYRLHSSVYYRINTNTLLLDVVSVVMNLTDTLIVVSCYCVVTCCPRSIIDLSFLRYHRYVYRLSFIRHRQSVRLLSLRHRRCVSLSSIHDGSYSLVLLSSSVLGIMGVVAVVAKQLGHTHL